MAHDLNDIDGAEVNDGTSVGSSGSISLTGAGVDFYRLLSLRQALKLHKAGIRISSRMPAATTIARKQFGLRGNVDSLISQVEAIVERVQEEKRKDRLYEDAIQHRRNQGGDHDA